MIAVRRGTFEVQVTARPPLLVSADGRGVVSHAGSRLLADLADRTTLTGEVSGVLAGLSRPRASHDPGRVLVDLAVAVADGAECISDVDRADSRHRHRLRTGRTRCSRTCAAGPP